jgi:hypothetical protein
LFILKTLLELKSKQGDVNVTCAFLHADLETDENVYVKIPLEFTQYSKNDLRKILKLKNALHGHSLQLSGNTSLRSSERAD